MVFLALRYTVRPLVTFNDFRAANQGDAKVYTISCSNTTLPYIVDLESPSKARACQSGASVLVLSVMVNG